MRVAIAGKRDDQLSRLRPGQCAPAEIPGGLRDALADREMPIRIHAVLRAFAEKPAWFLADDLRLENYRDGVFRLGPRRAIGGASPVRHRARPCGPNKCADPGVPDR